MSSTIVSRWKPFRAEGIRAEYQNGVLHMPKREESKPKQVKISVSGDGKK